MAVAFFHPRLFFPSDYSAQIGLLKFRLFSVFFSFRFSLLLPSHISCLDQLGLVFKKTFNLYYLKMNCLLTLSLYPSLLALTLIREAVCLITTVI